MVGRLVTHHRNVAGVRTCYEHILKVINADQPRSDVFSQGTQSMILGLSIIVMGAIEIL